MFGGDFRTGFITGVRTSVIGLVCNEIAHKVNLTREQKAWLEKMREQRAEADRIGKDGREQQRITDEIEKMFIDPHLKSAAFRDLAISANSAAYDGFREVSKLENRMLVELTNTTQPLIGFGLRQLGVHWFNSWGISKTITYTIDTFVAPE